MVYCVESKDTFNNCVYEWAPEVAHFCPDVPIILVGSLHCNRSDFDNRDECDRPVSSRCISEEEGKEAAKGMGKFSKHLCTANRMLFVWSTPVYHQHSFSV